MGDLKNAKVGDKLFITQMFSKRSFIATVIRTTKTRVEVECSYIFNRNGDTIPSSLFHGCARMATENDVYEIKKKRERIDLIYKCKKIDFNTLTNGQMKEILKIVENKI